MYERKRRKRYPRSWAFFRHRHHGDSIGSLDESTQRWVDAHQARAEREWAEHHMAQYTHFPMGHFWHKHRPREEIGHASDSRYKRHDRYTPWHHIKKGVKDIADWGWDRIKDFAYAEAGREVQRWIG